MNQLNDFELHGFLEVESLGLESHIHSSYGQYIAAFRKLNQFAWSMQFEFTVPKPERSIREAWSVILYARTLNFSQAAYMLALKGLRVQAETQLRCSLETLFRLGALKNHPDFLVEYDLSDRKDNIKKVRAIISHLQQKGSKDKKQIKSLEKKCKVMLTEFISKLRAHQPDTFLKYDDKQAFEKFSLPVSRIAQKAELTDLYDLAYRLSSSSVHSDAVSLENGHFVIGDSSEVEFLKNEPEIEELDDFIITICTVLLYSVDFIMAVLKVSGKDSLVTSLKKEIAELSS